CGRNIRRRIASVDVYCVEPSVCQTAMPIRCPHRPFTLFSVFFFKQKTAYEIRSYITTAIEQQHYENDGNKEDSETLLTHEMPVDIRLIDEQGQFIGLGAVSLNGRLQPKKLIQL